MKTQHLTPMRTPIIKIQ